MFPFSLAIERDVTLYLLLCRWNIQKASAMCARKITQRGFSIWPNSGGRGQFPFGIEMLSSNKEEVAKWNKSTQEKLT